MIRASTYDEIPNWVVNYFEPSVYWFNVLLCAIIAGIFYKNYKKNEAGKTFAFGLFAFGLCFTIARAIENYRKYFVADNRLDIVRGWVGLADPIYGINLILRVLYYVFSWISIATFYYATETHVFQKKTKYIFTISALAEGGVSIALYYTEGSVQKIFLFLAVAGFFICAVAPILLYLNMTIKSTGILKKSAFYATIGLTFFVLGVMTELPESLFVVYLTQGQFLDAWMLTVMAPLTMMLGFVFVYIGYKKMFASIF